LIENRRFEPTPPLFVASAASARNFAEIFGGRKLESLRYRLRDPTFRRFSAVPACDRVGQTDRRTHDDSTYRASIASRGKKSMSDI